MRSDLFRPPIRYRLALVVGWPTQFVMILLIGAIIVLWARDGWLLLPGLTLAGVSGWGIWRAWNVRIVLAEHKIIVANQLRTHVVPLDDKVHFYPERIASIFPSTTGVAILREGFCQPIAASGLLAAEERRRLGVELATSATTTGRHTSVSMGWESPWK